MREFVGRLARCRETVAGLGRDRRGTVAVLFALALAPLVFMVGAALDYSGAANLRTHLQKATDGTGLALCQLPINSSVNDLQTAATKLLTSYLGTTAYTVESITTTSNPWTVALATKSLFSTAIVRGLSSAFTYLPVTAYAKCYGQPQTFEIALVLDNTGSMNNSGGGTTKIQALRQAATDFVNFVYTSPKMSAGTRISVVPFASAVAVDPSTFGSATWIDQAGLSPYHWSIFQGGAVSALAQGWTSRFGVFDKLKTANSGWDWSGCLESLPYPLNVQDVSPTIANPGSLFIPMLSVDESGNGGENPNSGHADTNNVLRNPYKTVVSINSYLDDADGSLLCPTVTDEYARTGRACKYKALRNPKTTNQVLTTGPNVNCTTRPLTRLTRSQTLLNSEISQLQASGSTNIHEGLMWGWRTLSPVSVFKSGGSSDQTPTGYTTASDNKFNNKVVILMTDGANTWNANPFDDSTANTWNVLRSYPSAYGYIANPDGTGPTNRLPSANNSPTTGVATRAAIDQLTREGCDAVKAKNVKIYTIGFSVTGDLIDQQGLDLLSNCASAPSYFYVANNSSALTTVFQQIAQSIGDLRLTN